MILVATNGVFDLFHVEHVRFLRYARSLGDKLIVALNSDESVRSIKPGRPIIPEEERREILLACKYVDDVIIFNHSPAEVYKKIRPSILVKGADWRGKPLLGTEFVGEVIFKESYGFTSTTTIIKRIRECQT